MTMSFFEGMSAPRVRRALNVLTEAPFFYPADDPELFAWVRRHRVEIARFFAETFEWQLVVEHDVARLHKPRWHNDAITPKQRASFEPTRTGECIALLLLLELEPTELTMGELLAHGTRRLADLGVSERWDEIRLRDAYRDLIPALLRHRLIEELLPDAREDGDGDEKNKVTRYRALPGLRLYDRRAIDDRAIRAALGDRAVSDRVGAGAPSTEGALS